MSSPDPIPSDDGIYHFWAWWVRRRTRDNLSDPATVLADVAAFDAGEDPP